jgi:hypothetical protein
VIEEAVEDVIAVGTVLARVQYVGVPDMVNVRGGHHRDFGVQETQF